MTESVATTNRWILVISILLVVPGTLLSIAFGAIGLAMLCVLALDSLFAAVIKSDRRLPTLATPIQVLVAVGIAAALGGVIALGAWII